MGKCCLSTHGKDLSGNAKTIRSVLRFVHGVELWIALHRRGRGVQPLYRLASYRVFPRGQTEPNGGVFSLIADVDSKRSLCCHRAVYSPIWLQRGLKAGPPSSALRRSEAHHSRTMLPCHRSTALSDWRQSANSEQRQVIPLYRLIGLECCLHIIKTMGDPDHWSNWSIPGKRLVLITRRVASGAPYDCALHTIWCCTTRLCGLPEAITEFTVTLSR